MLAGDIRHEAQLRRGEHRAGGIAGVCKEDGARFFRDVRLDAGALGVTVAVLRRGRDGMHPSARHADKREVVRVIGLRDEHFVALVQNAQHGHEQRLAAAGGHEDVLRFKRGADARIIGADGLEQGGDAGGFCIGKHVTPAGLNGFKKGGRRLDIGLADIQLVDTDASLLRSDRVGVEFTDGRLGTVADFPGELHNHTSGQLKFCREGSFDARGHARARMRSTASVFSHGRSRSARPKWP